MNLAVPVKLDAFVFNKDVCNGNPGDATTPPDAKIAPLTQPNYTFLRLDNSVIQSDILDQVDLHNAVPWSNNPRLVDLGQNGAMRSKRLGVYLHWTIPRFYRSGIASTPSASSSQAQQRPKKGFAVPPETSNPDYSSPEFPQLPNRWLVIRQLDPGAATTIPNTAHGAQIAPVMAWIVESDRSRRIEDPTLASADLQVDVSPFITNQSTSSTLPGDISIGEQAETFIGYKTAASGWSENPTANRADLTVVSASNQLFPDYQPHCSNVFSILDPFTCIINGEAGNLTAAVANYYVMGWHSDAANDPLSGSGSSDGVTREALLKNLSMAPKGDAPWPQDIQDWLNSTDPGRVLCHGAMYEVQWNVDGLPQNMPANDASHLLADLMPVSVGTTPMDSLLGYLQSHRTTQLEQDLFALAPLLRAQDDGVQAQRVAMDELQTWDFSRHSGGVHWHLKNAAGNTAQDPTPDEAGYLEQLNNLQRLWDSTARQLVEVRWQMFSYWWQYASLSLTDRQNASYPLDQLSQQFTDLRALAGVARQAIETLSQDTTKFSQLPKPGVDQEFSQRRDPTLLIGGIEAGWPDDYLDTLLVRVDSQIIQPSTPMSDISAYCASVLPAALQPTAQALVQEFNALAPTLSAGGTPSDSDSGNGDTEYVPLYHDHGKHGDPSGPLRDQWGATQPWFPLFIEWEVEYFHIKWDDWQLNGELKSQLDQRWKLGIKPDVDLSQGPNTDTRTLSGRILLLPQPNFALSASIADLFSNADPKLIAKYLPYASDQQLVQNDAYTLPFMSAPMDGFTAELLTLMKGTHIKPNTRFPQTGYDIQGLQPLPDAEIGPFGQNELGIIGAKSEETPFGTLVLFGSSEPTQIPFKPCTHGQFRFTKLNVIDKFGQAICAIDPRYGYEETQAVYPCLSDFFAPGQLDNGQPNIVETPPKPGYCELAQVPPAINQPARLNCCFVAHDTRQDSDPSNYSYWRPTTEWENPIWGWVVLNYADYGIQFFLPDGTFYREVRIAAPTAPITSPLSAKWLPFDPPTTPVGGPDAAQLDQLLALLTAQDQTYLLAFISMLNQSLETCTSAPGAYGTFLNSLVGRPMALVNAAWSVELAADAKTDQSSLDGHETKQQDTGLLEGAEIYQFPLKIGDMDRAHDGLVGYFNALAGPKPGNELDLSVVYTYYTGDGDGDGDGGSPTVGVAVGPLNGIGPDNYPALASFWLNPETYLGSTQQPRTLQQSADAYAQAWNNNLKVFGLVVDPFTAITSYTGGVFPIGSLQLPPCKS